MICGHVVLSQPFTLLQVPLSCVPPWTSHGFDGLIDTPTNWSVCERILSVCPSSVGTRDRSRLQFARLAAPSNGRSPELQCPERSENVPLVRINAPSDDSKICVGLLGLIAISCWSGWIESGAHRHWNGGVTPPAVSSAPSSAHQLAGRS